MHLLIIQILKKANFCEIDASSLAGSAMNEI
jgi:hypothetical protein